MLLNTHSSLRHVCQKGETLRKYPFVVTPLSRCANKRQSKLTPREMLLDDMMEVAVIALRISMGKHQPSSTCVCFNISRLSFFTVSY